MSNKKNAQNKIKKQGKQAHTVKQCLLKSFFKPKYVIFLEMMYLQ